MFLFLFLFLFVFVLADVVVQKLLEFGTSGHIGGGVIPRARARSVLSVLHAALRDASANASASVRSVEVSIAFFEISCNEGFKSYLSTKAQAVALEGDGAPAKRGPVSGMSIWPDFHGSCRGARARACRFICAARALRARPVAGCGCVREETARRRRGRWRGRERGRRRGPRCGSGRQLHARGAGCCADLVTGLAG